MRLRQRGREKRSLQGEMGRLGGGGEYPTWETRGKRGERERERDEIAVELTTCKISPLRKAPVDSKDPPVSKRYISK